MNTEHIDVNQGGTYIDKFGVEYSSDKKRLIKGCNIEHYIVMKGTEIICDYAFKSLNIKNIVLLVCKIQKGVIKMILQMEKKKLL